MGRHPCTALVHRREGLLLKCDLHAFLIVSLTFIYELLNAMPSPVEKHSIFFAFGQNYIVSDGILKYKG